MIKLNDSTNNDSAAAFLKLLFPNGLKSNQFGLAISLIEVFKKMKEKVDAVDGDSKQFYFQEDQAILDTSEQRFSTLSTKQK